ncbi:MAG TPA: GAF domain-containing protein [Balneolaceae bacterium]|nr:GAF domain-containing protein [Balneolaceae bacterium]
MIKISSDKLIKRIKEIVYRGSDRNEILQEICDILEREVPVFDWVGFYLVDPEAERELILGPFVGEETEHRRIPFGRGICGQAAESNETFVVQDVSQADNYLACSLKVKAEVVVPVMKDSSFVAELDIDSHTQNSISEEHRAMLEEICDIVAEIF